MNKNIFLFLAGILISVVFVFSVSGENWDITITATNQLEPITFGLHESATDGYDAAYDVPYQNPVQDKVFMGLDGVYAIDIKALNYPKDWDFDIGVPSTTTLSWNVSSLPAHVNLTLYNTSFTLDMNTLTSLELGEGSHTFTLLASEQCVPSTEVCDGVDNDCDGSTDEDLTQDCGSGNCQGTRTCTAGDWGDCSTKDEDTGICAICDEDGNEVYDGTQDSDCDQYDLPEIADCFNDPDGNPYTWDYAAEFDSVCSGINQCTQGSYSYDHTCDVETCNAECEDDPDCADKCVGDEYWTSGSCTEDCSCFYAEEDCDQYDSWEDTGNTRWVDIDDCNEKEQKEQEYRDYGCGAQGCEYQVTATQWVDIGNTRNKDDGTVCDDGLFCTIDDQCTSGVCGGSDRDCSGNDLDPVEQCDYSPDDILFTWDYFAGFTSVCNEDSNECTTGAVSLTHTCDFDQCNAECDDENACDSNICSETYDDYCSDLKLVEYDDNKVLDSTIVDDSCENTCLGDCTCTDCDVDCSEPATNTYCVENVCGAECDVDNDCTATDCDNSDGCVGYDYYDYDDVENTCQEECDCTQNICGEPTIYENDARCTPCQIDDDCDAYDEDYCDGDTIKHKEGRCINYECEPEITIIEDCDESDDTYCQGTEIWEEDGYCLDAVCEVDTDMLQDCDDGAYCNGQETCEAAQCVGGTVVDCSGNDLPGIAECFNDPDNNPFTWDYAEEFTSTCDEINDECTSDQYDYSHECSTEACDAECEEDGDCQATDCDDLDGCYNNAYYDCDNVPNTCLGSCQCEDNQCTDDPENNCQYTGTDVDGDGYDLECEDCNDNDATIYPGAPEIDDDVNQDCKNDAPILSRIENITVNETDEAVINVSAKDTDGHTLYYYTNDSNFVQNDNIFTWQTPDESAGIYSVLITVSDGELNFSIMAGGGGGGGGGGGRSILNDSQEVIITVNDACTPSWQCIGYDECQPNERKECNEANDTNDCYAQTNLPSDQYSDDYSEFLGFCDYDNNGIIGNEITTNIEGLSISIGNLTDLTQNFTDKLKVEFKEGNITLVEFEFNFSEETLNLDNIIVEEQEANASNGGIIISGIDLTAQGETKTVLVDRLAEEDYVCVKDEEVASIDELPPADCSSGTAIPCPGSSGAFTCSLVNNNTQFKVEGLSYSGITESTYAPPPPAGPTGGGGGGGGGGRVERACLEAWTCTDWTPIVCPATRQQTRTCIDANNCGTEANKPNEIRTCFYYVALEGVEEAAKVAEEAPPTVAPPEEAPPAPTPGMIAITGAAIGIAYQQRPLTMGILSVFILLIAGLFIYSHAKNLKHWPFHFKHSKKWLVILVIIILLVFIALFIHFVLKGYFGSV